MAPREQDDEAKALLSHCSDDNLSNGSLTSLSHSIHNAACPIDTHDDDALNNNHTRSPAVAAVRHLLQPNGRIVGADVAAALLPAFSTFQSALPPTMALHSVDGRAPLTHDRLQQVISHTGAALHAVNVGVGQRVALVLPNGPELAVALLAVTPWAAAVPLSQAAARSELRSDMAAARCQCVIGMAASYNDNRDNQDKRETTHDDEKEDPVRAVAAELGIPYLGLVPSATEAGFFTLHSLYENPYQNQTTTHRQNVDTRPNTHEDEVLVLFTSGTTGRKKLVPHLQGDILTAAATIALSWNLTTRDVNLNMMPLFHGTYGRRVLYCIVLLYSLYEYIVIYRKRERENHHIYIYIYIITTALILTHMHTRSNPQSEALCDKSFRRSWPADKSFVAPTLIPASFGLSCSATPLLGITPLPPCIKSFCRREKTKAAAVWSVPMAAPCA